MFLHQTNRLASRLSFLAGLALVCTLAGCDKPQLGMAEKSFEPNYVFAMVNERLFETPTDQSLLDAQVLVEEMFGTPDAPKLPEIVTEDYPELMSMESLQIAAGEPVGPVDQLESGLYRQLCVSCHGETGQGRGTVAASQNPYPRNFRRGVFKFKSTPRNSKPTKSDITTVLHRGLEGSQMPKFDTLPDEQLNALSEYVIYLSVRGEFERALIRFASMELDLDDGTGENRLYERGSDSQEDQRDIALEELEMILDSWLEAEDEVEDFEPENVAVIGITEDIDEDELEASIARGRELFVGTVATCGKCHGESGKGDGVQLPDYDDWTKEFTTGIEIEPTNTDELLPFLVHGAMPPQPLSPRNLTEGKFRGGGEATDIYRRIRYGIAGSPMPAAAMSDDPEQPGLSEDDLWHLVNYVLSLSQTDI